MFLRPIARADLADIWTFTVDRWCEPQAECYFKGLDETLALLCNHPEIAYRYGKSAPPVRIHRYRSHLVIFIVDEATVEVLRVVHSRANWQGLLAD